MMSCSQFIEHDEEDKSDTLVIIVNGDGTVTVDPRTLERVLSNQCRAAVSVIKLEESSEPDSQTEKGKAEKNEKSADDKELFCHKVNLVVEGYYPPPPLNMNNKNSDSVVSSTVDTPLPQTSSDFIDLLSEGLETSVSLSDGQADIEDTLTIPDQNDGWVHIDHCYTNFYSGNKIIAKQVDNVTIQEEQATMTTIEVDPVRTITEPIDGVSSHVEISDAGEEIKTDNAKNSIHPLRVKRTPFHVITKVKKKVNIKNDLNKEHAIERIVKVDEVDGVRVFKPSRNDRVPKLWQSGRSDASNAVLQKSSLVQSKLKFMKGDQILREKSNSMKEEDSSKSDVKLVKKETIRNPSITSELFGPALFSTPDIIKKTGSDETSRDDTLFNLSPIDSSDLEKRMSAIENGEMLENCSISFMEHLTPEIRRVEHVQDDSRLLSDLENSADESSQPEEIVMLMSDIDSSKKLLESVKSHSSDDENDDIEYEDDPNKLWCICNKPHNNRFMICCDACDNWFHGYCVGITKAMGEKMEQNGTEWLCPSCKKEKCVNERDSKPKSSARATSNRGSAKRRNIHKEWSSNTSSSTNRVSVEAEMASSPQQAANQVSASRRKSLSQVKSSTGQICLGCKENVVMSDGLYCSNACIGNYVAACIESMNAQLACPMSEDQKIIVLDRKRESLITGMRAPSVENLVKWLIEHPTYEVVKPSAFPIFRSSLTPRETKPASKGVDSSKMTVIKVKDLQSNVIVTKSSPETVKSEHTEAGSTLQQSSMRQYVVDKHDEKGKVEKISDVQSEIKEIVLKPSDLFTQKDADVKAKEKQQRPIKLIPLQPKPTEEFKMTPLGVKIGPSKVTLKPPIPVIKKPAPNQTPPVEKTVIKRKAEVTKKDKVVKKSELKRQDSKKVDNSPTPEPAPGSGAVEKQRIRTGIRNSLKELFVSRLTSVRDMELKEEELTILANQVETELYNLFNDTGPKYKSKYRSLRFNIKDEKNNLFRRIAEKALKPFELVRLTPEELASAELAQWRERAAKHEIDMIKKTELENLSQTKVLVLKTHKGELEIEPDALPPSVNDIVVPDLQPDELPAGMGKNKKLLPHDASKLKLDCKTRELSNKECGKKNRDKDKNNGKRYHRDKRGSRKHQHRSFEKERHSSPSCKRSKSKDNEKISDLEHHHNRSCENSSRRSLSTEKDRSKKSSVRNYESKNAYKKQGVKKRRFCSPSHRKDQTPEELVAHVPADEDRPEHSASALPTVKEMPMTIKDQDDEKIVADLLNSYNAVDVDLSDMEPTSTVTIQTPPHAASPEYPPHVWKGFLVMPDVVRLHARLREVSGHCAGLEDELPAIIDCVGRINPNTVWEYISKTKKSGSREILVVRFEPMDDEQRANYFNLYSYLNRKDRMAVVGAVSSGIKDFYVIPLAGRSPIPQVLLPLDGPGFEDSRSHLLLGVIIRSRRQAHASSVVSAKKDKELYMLTVPSYSTSSRSTAEVNDAFTPPHSPTSISAVVLPTTSSLTKNDEDEPYNPEDEEPYSPGAIDEEEEPDQQVTLDIQEEMELLNRQIEERKQQIESISSGLPQRESIDELYTLVENSSSELETSNVQLPGDLQQLLNSLSRRTAIDAVEDLTLEEDLIDDGYKTIADANDVNVIQKEEDDGGKDEVIQEVADSPKKQSDERNLSPRFSSPESEGELELGASPEPEDVESRAVANDSKMNRDPRCKAINEPYKTLDSSSQPPPPGMEDEYNLVIGSVPNTPTNSDLVNISSVVSDSSYAITPYLYSTVAQIAPAFAPPPLMAPVAPMYMTVPPPAYTQPNALPFSRIPTQPMYITPSVALPNDPSMIPLPGELSDVKTPLKRKITDGERDKHKNWGSSRRSDSRGKKLYRDSKSPPNRHSSSSYNSHYRGYRRDEGDYRSGGRYRSDRSYDQGRSRSSYWKGSSGDYSSSSSRRRYSGRESRDRRSRSKERSRSPSRHGSRWDSSFRGSDAD